MADTLSTSTSHSVTLIDDLPTTSQAVVSGGEGGISPALASFIAQTVQAALAAEQLAHSSPPVLTTPPQSTADEVPHWFLINGKFMFWGRSVIAGQLS